MDKISKFFIPVLPVPASRPRVTRFGTFFTKNYVDFRNSCYNFLKNLAKQHPPESGTFAVSIEFICKKPNKPTNPYPNGDVDNFLKGPLDAITKTGLFWNDDTQVVKLEGSKRYQEKGEEFGMHVTIIKLN